MAAGSLRCVAIAYRPCKGETVPTDEDELAHWELPEGDLVLLAIIGLKVCAGLATFDWHMLGYHALFLYFNHLHNSLLT